jgi:hypothetical protein
MTNPESPPDVQRAACHPRCPACNDPSGWDVQRVYQEQGAEADVPTPRDELSRALDALAFTSFAVVPISATCRIVEPGRGVRRREARAGTRGRRGARRVPPRPLYLVAADRPAVVKREDLDRLDAALAPHGYQVDSDHYADRLASEVRT